MFVILREPAFKWSTLGSLEIYTINIMLSGIGGIKKLRKATMIARAIWATIRSFFNVPRPVPGTPANV